MLDKQRDYYQHNTATYYLFLKNTDIWLSDDTLLTDTSHSIKFHAL